MRSILTVLGANLLELQRAGFDAVRVEALPLVVGFGVACATGVLSLRALQWVVAQRRLLPFALYCALLGGGVMLLG